MSTAIVPSDESRHIPTAFEGKIEPNYYCRGWNAKRLKYCRNRAGAGTDHKGTGRCKMHLGNPNPRITHGLRSKVVGTRLQALIDEHAANPNPLDTAPELCKARALMDDFIARYEENTAAILAWHQSWDGRSLAEDQRLALLRCLDELEGMYREREITPAEEDALARARAAVGHLAAERVAKPRQILDISDAVRHADVISKIVERVQRNQSQNAISFQRLASFLFEVNRVLDNLVPDRKQLERINAEILRIRI